MARCPLRLRRRSPPRKVTITPFHRGKIPRMKSLLQSRTPTQLLWIIATSNALISFFFGMAFLQSRRVHHAPLTFSRDLLWLAALAVGFVATLLSEQTLKNGVASERWPEALLITPRKLVEQPTFTILIWLLFVASCASIAFTKADNLAMSWLFLTPAMSLTRVRNSLRPQNRLVEKAALLDPSKPLQSDHWGNRVANL